MKYVCSVLADIYHYHYSRCIMKIEPCHEKNKTYSVKMSYLACSLSDLIGRIALL